MNVYDLLHKDHLTVKDLFEKLKKTDETKVDKREKLFATLHKELTAHALAEEKLFYRKSEKESASHSITLEALEEHKVMKHLLKSLAADDKGTEQWAAKLSVLIENTEHHVKEEEGDLFEKCRKVFSPEEAEEIGREIQLFKKDLSKQKVAVR
jgi:hemerythrin-like domain-containing protein